MKKLQSILYILCFILAGYSNAAAQDWTTIDNAVAKTDAQHQFIFVDIYTDWCGWCKKMDQIAFGDPATLANLKNNFVLVKFNAEAEIPVTFNGKTYNLVANGNRKANELALNIGAVGGRIGYPTLVVLDSKGNKLQAFPGYKDADTINQLIKYFTSGSYQSMDFLTFQSKN
jgi:thioredoxin-related protein